MKPIGNSRFEVHFTPKEASTHIVSINFNGGAVTGNVFNKNFINKKNLFYELFI